MIELTESESIETIDFIAETYKEIVEKAYKNPREVKESPKNTSVGRLDPLVANHPRTLAPTYKYIGRIRQLLKR